MTNKGKLVCGVGINDADYTVIVKEIVGFKEDGTKIIKQVWICPFYRVWQNMLTRCYSDKYKVNRPTYEYCTTVPEWHYFMTFRAWMEKQDWIDRQLDKDLLVPGNKVYGPETCVFIDSKVNSFILERNAARGDCPIGVTFCKRDRKYMAGGWNVETGKRKNLGCFDDPDKAHQAWLCHKLSQARILAEKQSDPRVAKALIDRYENYHTYFPKAR